jgi:hypothetical protein
VHIIKRNVVHEPLLALDEKVILRRHERLGRLAWDEMVRQYGCQFSDDYRDGFIDGFVDYLTYGGCAADCGGEEPMVPAVPPPYYRRAKAMSPQGLQASEEWFMGFRHGSSTALASGLRQLVVIPVFDRPKPSTETSPGRFQSMNSGQSQSTAGPTAAPSTEGEPLPPPRPVPLGDTDAKPPPAPAPPLGPAPANPPPPPVTPAPPPR